MPRLLLSMIALLLAPITVLAGEMPKEGTDSFTNTWLVTTLNSMKVGDRTLGTYEVSGVHQNVQGDPATDMGPRRSGAFRRTHGTPPVPDSVPETFYSFAEWRRRRDRSARRRHGARHRAQTPYRAPVTLQDLFRHGFGAHVQAPTPGADKRHDAPYAS